MDYQMPILRNYLRTIMQERNLSNRALALYAGVAEGTIRNVLAGKHVGHSTLDRLARYLNLPAENVYRMAGILPEQAEKQELIDLIVFLLAKLPEKDQQEIVSFIRFKFEEYMQSEQDGAASTET